MNKVKAVIDKKIDWREYDVLGFDLSELKQGKYSWWSSFVKTYDRVYVEIYDKSFEVLLTKKNGEKTQLKQLSYNHYKLKMTDSRDILLLITHPDVGNIYFAVNNEDIIAGTWREIVKAGRPKPTPAADKPFANCKF